MNPRITSLSALLFLLLVTISPVSATGTNSGNPQGSESSLQPYSISSIISYSRLMIGTPYRFGGITEKGFDCSGLMNYVFEAHGLDLARSSAAIFDQSSGIEMNELQPGDFLFFRGRNNANKRIGHIALISAVEEGEIKMIHATNRGVVEDIFQNSPYYQKRLIAAARKYDFEALTQLKAVLTQVESGLHFRM